MPYPVDSARSLGPMRVVLTTFPTARAAETAIGGALARRLAACASAFPVDSRFHWDGRIDSARETMVLFKTVPKRVGALFRFLAATHPYRVPEISEIDVPRVAASYLAYLNRTLDAPSLRASDLEVPVDRSATRRGGRRARAARPRRRTRAPPRRRSR